MKQTTNNNKKKTHMKTQKYSSFGFRSVTAESFADAAQIFAARSARRKYGRRGYARTVNCTSHSTDGKICEYAAFVGYSTGLHETTGHNIVFSVQL